MLVAVIVITVIVLQVNLEKGVGSLVWNKPSLSGVDGLVSAPCLAKEHGWFPGSVDTDPGINPEAIPTEPRTGCCHTKDGSQAGGSISKWLSGAENY